MNKSGFTLLELVIVLSIVGILAVVATPHYARARRMANAARIVCDFNAIVKVAMTSYAEHQEFPPSAAWGETPARFSSLLPRSFAFRYRGVIYRWRRWSLPSGLPERPDQEVLIGLEVRTKDSRLLDFVLGVYQGRTAQVTETQVTMVIF